MRSVPSVNLLTLQNQFVKSHATNATDSAFASKVATLTEPTGDGVIDLKGGNVVLLLPYGVGNADTTYDLRVIGWSAAGPEATREWVPTILGEFSCTLGTATGASGGYLGTSNKFVDTITNLAAYDDLEGVTFRLRSPANNTPAAILIDAEGHQKVEIIFDMTGATSGAALVKQL